jgi:heterogeneous nuclear ribonucleoprotein A1/A3
MDSDSEPENFESGPSDSRGNEYFIGGIQPKTPKKVVRDYFAQFGDIRELRLMRDKMTKRFRGFGFISYNSVREGLVLEDMQHHLAGANIQIKKALSKETTQNILLDEKDRKLFVNGLHADTQEPEILAYFEQFGDVENVKVIREKGTQKSRGFAFLLYKSVESAAKLLAAPGPHVVAECSLEVHPSINKEELKEASTPMTASASRDQTETSRVGSQVSNSIASAGQKKVEPDKAKALTAVSEGYAHGYLALATKRAEKLEKTFQTANNKPRRTAKEQPHDFSGATYGPSDYSSSSTLSKISHPKENPEMLQLLARFKTGEIDEATMLWEISRLTKHSTSGYPKQPPTSFTQPPYYPPHYQPPFSQEPGYQGYPYYPPLQPTQPFGQQSAYPPYFNYPNAYPRHPYNPADEQAQHPPYLPPQYQPPAFRQPDDHVRSSQQQIFGSGFLTAANGAAPNPCHPTPYGVPTPNPKPHFKHSTAFPATSNLEYPPLPTMQPQAHPFVLDQRFDHNGYPPAGHQHPPHSRSLQFAQPRGSPEDTLNFSSNKPHTYQLNGGPTQQIQSASKPKKGSDTLYEQESDAYDGDSILESSIFDLKIQMEHEAEKFKSEPVKPQAAAALFGSKKAETTNQNQNQSQDSRKPPQQKKPGQPQADSLLLSEEEEDDKQIESLFGFQVVEEGLPLPTRPLQKASNDTSCMKFLKRKSKLSEAWSQPQGTGMLHSDQPRPKQSKK